MQRHSRPPCTNLTHIKGRDLGSKGSENRCEVNQDDDKITITSQHLQSIFDINVRETEKHLIHMKKCIGTVEVYLKLVTYLEDTWLHEDSSAIKK